MRTPQKSTYRLLTLRKHSVLAWLVILAQLTTALGVGVVTTSTLTMKGNPRRPSPPDQRVVRHAFGLALLLVLLVFGIALANTYVFYSSDSTYPVSTTLDLSGMTVGQSVTVATDNSNSISVNDDTPGNIQTQYVKCSNSSPATSGGRIASGNPDYQFELYNNTSLINCVDSVFYTSFGSGPRAIALTPMILKLVKVSNTGSTASITYPTFQMCVSGGTSGCFTGTPNGQLVRYTPTSSSATVVVNSAPVITSNGGGATASVSVAENQTTVTTVTATDSDGNPLSYSITGGADSAKFSINSSTGVLTFVTAPDFENPTDVGANNVYDVQVTVSDGNGGSDVQAIGVTVTNVNDTPDLTTAIGQPSPAFVAGSPSNVPLTVNNIGGGPTTGTVTAVMTLPANTSAPASFSNNGWTCSTSGQTVTCTTPGPINAGGSSTVQVPVTPNASTVGTQPVFNGTSSTPGETNTGNNAAPTMTPITPVAAPPAGSTIATVDKKFSSDGVTFSDAITVTAGQIITERIYYNNINNTAGLTATISATLPAGFTLVAGSTKNCSNPTTGETVCNTSAGQGGAINEGAVWSGQTLNIAPTAGLYGQGVGMTSGVLEIGKKRYLNLHECHYTTLVGGDSASYNNFGTNTNNTAETTITCSPIGGTTVSSAVVALDLLARRHLNLNECQYVNFANTNGDVYNVSGTNTNTSNTPDGSPICSPLAGYSVTGVVGPFNLLGKRYFNLNECQIVDTGNTNSAAYNVSGANTNTSNTPDSVATCTAPGAGYNVTAASVLALDTLDTARGQGYIEFRMVATTAGSFTQNASLSGNNFSAQTDSGNLTVNVAVAPDLTTTIGQPSPAFVAGSPSNVPMTVNNIGTGPTTGTVTAVMTLPAGMSAPASFSNNGWSCTTSGQTVTCTTPGPINAGGSSTLQVPVTPNASTVGTTPTFNGTSSGGGETNTANNSSSMTPTTPVAAATAPDLTTTLGQPQPQLMAGVQSNLPVTVTNQGTAPASGPLQTTVTLPSGVSAPATFVSNGWNCTTSGQTVTCSNAGSLTNGASSTFNVPVTAAAAGGPVTFNATTSPVSGESNTGNNAAAPLTTSSGIAAFVDGCFNTAVTLNGSQETPPNSSTATGSASVTVNTTANTLAYSLSFSGLSPNMAHIHGPAAPGVSAGILHNLPGLSSPQTSQWSFSEGEQATILNGLTYFNLHTATYSGGEIRGQISALTPTACPAVILPVKVLLQGAYDSATGLMRDQLRSLSSFPLTSPYGDGAVIASSSVLTANNIVDWVLVELRGTGAMSTTVVASKGALLQRDGDVVGTDGVSTLSFTGLSGSSYHVVVRHRNHLGIMTANPVTLSASTPVVDFTSPSTAVFVRTRTVAQKLQSGKLLMWGGDANGDGDVKGAGPGTDPGSVRQAVLSHPGNTTFAANYIAVGYAKADVTLNGQTIGAGSGNEISNVILPNVLSHPGNPTLQNNYIICQQLPEDPCN